MYCKCGAIIAACMEPLCYQDKDWQKDIRKYSTDGYDIKMVDSAKVRLLFGCTCKLEQIEMGL